jgi:hypothetical protein
VGVAGAVDASGSGNAAEGSGGAGGGTRSRTGADSGGSGAALTALRAEGSHLAAVTGGKGAVLGFVTTEDVLSELVGLARPTA